MQTFSDVIQWLAAGGSVIVTAWFAAWLLEDWSTWQRLRPQVKKLLILLAALLIGVGAQALRQNAALLDALQPYLDTAVLVVIAWVATQVAHKADTLRST